MLFILLLTKPLNMSWGETKLVFIILLLLVCFGEGLNWSMFTDHEQRRVGPAQPLPVMLS